MDNKRGYVGILVTNRQQRKYVLNQYLPYNTAPVKLFCFTPSSIDWDNKTVVGLYRSNRQWKVGRFPFPKVVYNRCYGTNEPLIERIGATIGNDRCFNHINRLNKLDVYSHLSRWLADYLPDTRAYEAANAIPMLDRYKVVYFKPCCGHKGKGVYRAELKGSGEILLGHHYFSPKTIVTNASSWMDNVRELIGDTPYIMQQGIAFRRVNGSIFDIRALVQKNEKGQWSVTNLVSRIAFAASYNTSIFVKACLSQDVLKRLYPSRQVNAITESIYSISLRTAEILDMNTDYHLGEFSVDIALDNDGHPWIIELNGKPQKDLYRGIPRQQAVYRRPIEYARYLLKR